MEHAMRISCLLIPIVLAAAITTSYAQEQPGTDTAKDRLSVLPWDKAEVRASMPWGMVFTYEVQDDTQQKNVLKYEFVPLDEMEVTTTEVRVSSKGLEQREQSRTRKWERHLDDLLDNLKDAAVSTEELTLGDKKYHCKLLTSQQATGATARAWFCKEVPGMWLKHEVLKGDNVVVRHVLTGMDTYWVALPWKVNELPTAMKDDARFKYKLHTNSGAYYLQMDFTAVTAEQYTAKHSRYELDGESIGQPATGEVTWSQHFKNFMVRKAAAKVADSKITVGKDTLDCISITTEESSGESKRTRTIHLSKKHPGLMTSQVSETITPDKTFKTVWELVEFKYGK